MSKSKQLEPIKAKDINSASALDKYILISDYKIDNSFPFSVKKIFKKDKISHYYFPLVSPSNPKKIIALVKESGSKDSLLFSTSAYSDEVNLPKNYFEKDIESKLLNGERQFYESQGFQFSESILQLKIDEPPTAFYRYLSATIIAILLLMLLLASFIPNKALNKLFDQYTGVDYTYGIKTIKSVLKSTRYGKYDKAVNQLKQLDADEITQAVDALALMLSIKDMDKWKKSQRNTPLYKLIVGSRMVYEAWEKRGYAYAAETNEANALGFLELLEIAKKQLTQVQGFLKIEANNILIRVNKGLSDVESSKRDFEACIMAESKHIMPHLGYLDVLLPKWFGSSEEAEEFIEQHKRKSEILKYLLETKWLFEKARYYEDEDFSNEINNYFSKSELGIRSLNTKNPNKYLLYNYMYLLADEVGNKKLSKRYYKKQKDFLSPTLYTPLRSEKEIKAKLG